MIDAPAVEVLEAGVHQVHHADQVDVDGVDPRLHRAPCRERGDAGVGDHDVELPNSATPASMAAASAARSRTSAIAV